MPDITLTSRKVGEAMGEAIRDAIRRHLIAKSNQTKPNRHGLPHTGYYHKAAGTVRVEDFDETRAEIVVGADSEDSNAPGQGLALHYYGGVVRPRSGKKALAIPIDPSVAGMWPSEVGAIASGDGLALIWPKNSSHGFLKDNENGRLLWLLVRKAQIPADETVLPTAEELEEAASNAISEVMDDGE